MPDTRLIERWLPIAALGEAGDRGVEMAGPPFNFFVFSTRVSFL